MTDCTADARERFKALVQTPNGLDDLARAALLIAAEEYPALPVACYLARLDDLAERVRSKLHPQAGPHETLACLTQVLAIEEGFQGDRDRYHDPRNSFLNDVLDRHKGIPITLSTVYMEVGRRIGFPLQGVGFPGHYLIKYATADGEIVLDPFHRGRVLERADLRVLLEETFQGKLEYRDTFLRAVTPRQHLFRMLKNLKAIYVSSKDPVRALSAVERMMLLDPDAAMERRDRGVLLARLNRCYEALHELHRYRELVPDSDDAKDVDSLIEQLETRASMSN